MTSEKLLVTKENFEEVNKILVAHGHPPKFKMREIEEVKGYSYLTTVASKEGKYANLVYSEYKGFYVSLVSQWLESEEQTSEWLEEAVNIESLMSALRKFLKGDGK